MSESIGDRLKQLRKQHHFTQIQIADYLGFKQGQIAKLENNQRKLKLSSLEKLCQLYNCSEDYIIDGIDEYSEHNFAFRSNVRNLNLDNMAKMNNIIRNMELLCRLLGEKKEEKRQIPDNYLGLSEKADMCKSLWHVDKYSPIDIFQVALEKLDNLTLCFLDLEDNFSGASYHTYNQNIVFINSNHPLGRQKFTLAHEIYHLRYDDTFNNCDIDHGDDSVEAAADEFASQLLLSNSTLFRYEQENNIKEWNIDEIIQTEQYFQISHKAMLRKLVELGKITEYQMDEMIGGITYKAAERGYDTKLYFSNTNRKELVLGNYIQLVNKAFDEGVINQAYKQELLFHAFFDNLVENIDNEVDLVER